MSASGSGGSKGGVYVPSLSSGCLEHSERGPEENQHSVTPPAFSGEPCRRGPCSHAAARSLRGALLSSQTWVVATSGQDLELIRTREGRDERDRGAGTGGWWEGVARFVVGGAVVCAAQSHWWTPGPRHSGSRGPMGKTQGTHGAIQSAGNFYGGVLAHRHKAEGKNGPRRKASHPTPTRRW